MLLEMETNIYEPSSCSGKFCFLAVVCNLIFHTEETSNNLDFVLRIKGIPKATLNVYQGKSDISEGFLATFNLTNK